jgi:hypothetical protein
MKTHIDEMHQGGVILDEENYKGVQILYSIEDGETGRSLSDQEFSSREAAEAYAASCGGCSAWIWGNS